MSASTGTKSSGTPSTRLVPAKEQSALLPGSQAKPTNVYIPGWANVRDAALDVIVVSSLQKEIKKRADAEAASAAERRHSDKLTKYFRDCDREGIQFFPIVVEALGAGTKTQQLLCPSLPGSWPFTQGGRRRRPRGTCSKG